MIPFSKNTIATAIAILFHSVGLVGMLYFKSNAIVNATPIHLLLMAALLIYTQPQKNRWFLIFFLACFVLGLLAEYIGISTAMLFGQYQYGRVLGPAVGNVPLIIGINWFIIIYCCGVCMHLLMHRLKRALDATTPMPAKKMQQLSMIIDGATLAVFIDWLMEPVAIKLGYWSWAGNAMPPLYNYFCWFVLSVLLLYLFYRLPFARHNKFALHLLMIQAMFFLLLRTFL